MDQVKTGKFIADLRKEKAMTQLQLADRLSISDKTVSKWERGRGLPEVALMLPLCETLGITVNELLSGERLAAEDYQRKAEENMMDLVKEREENKKKIVLEVAVVMITLLAGITLAILSGLLEMEAWLRSLLIVIALVVTFGGIAVVAVLDRSAGTYECRRCGHRFVPTAGKYLAGMHTITTRYLRCPKCGQRSWCKKRLTH